jgi:5-methylcytosine-specific restriction endonuclease McrA
MNRERAREQTRKWRRANPELWAEQKRRAAAVRRERGLTIEQAEAARRRARDYAKANPEKVKVHGRKSALTYRSRKRSLFVEHVDPRVVFTNGNGICGVCNTPIDPATEWHVDHVIPLSKGGEHSYANTQPAHGFCNRSKGAKMLVAA